MSATPHAIRLERRHIFGAEVAAREMGFMPLRDALGLLALYASEGSPKYDKAATRWLARLARDRRSRTRRLPRLPSRFPTRSHAALQVLVV